MMEITKTNEITDAINDVIADINTILDEEKEERYLEGIILLYGLIEGILKVSLLYRMILDRIDELANEDICEDAISEVRDILDFIGKLDFYKSLRFALSVGLIEYDLFLRLDEIRKNRNNVVHQLWLLQNRKDIKSLRAELENLATQTSALIAILNELIDEVGLGIEEAYLNSFLR